jgi:hypothetical protein
MPIKVGDTFKVSLIADAKVTAFDGNLVTYKLSSVRTHRTASVEHFLRMVRAA